MPPAVDTKLPWFVTLPGCRFPHLPTDRSLGRFESQIREMDAWDLINAGYREGKSLREVFGIVEGLNADDRNRLATQLMAIICDPKHGFEIRSEAIDKLRGIGVLLNIHRSTLVAEQLAEVLGREFVNEMIAYVAKVHDEFIGFSPCVNFYQGLLRTVIVINYQLGKDIAERILPTVKNTRFEEWLRDRLHKLKPDLE